MPNTNQREDILPIDELNYTHPPWRWHGNTKFKRLSLITPDRGRLYIMDFCRWGMQGAQPRFRIDGWMHDLDELVKPDWHGEFWGIDHPDARMIESAGALYQMLMEAQNILLHQNQSPESALLLKRIERISDYVKTGKESE